METFQLCFLFVIILFVGDILFIRTAKEALADRLLGPKVCMKVVSFMVLAGMICPSISQANPLVIFGVTIVACPISFRFINWGLKPLAPNTQTEVIE